jgi:bifunctional non-homologous end joining protein LigD
MSASLDDYRRKRDFGATPEPSGDPDGGAPTGALAALPRFVVHEHHARRLHWDLRLERDGVLASWAVPNGLPHDPQQNRKAVHTEDHPLEYVDFHGTIPAGSYGAGEMSIWDAGTYETEKWREDEVIVVFHGERLRGRYVLFQAGKDAKDWLVHRMDPPEDPDAEPMPERLAPMLARTGPLPHDEERWAFEVKWDGLRALVHSRPGRLRIETRTGREVTGAYPELRGINAALSHHEAILDGEVVAFDEDGRPSFAALQPRMAQHGQQLDLRAVRRRTGSRAEIVLLLFDLLWLDGHPLVDLPYAERREQLAALGLEGDHWRVSPSHPGEGRALLEATAAQGLEGVVAKRLDSPYRAGRDGRWRKIKHVLRQELVVGGWTPGGGGRATTFGALQLGVHDAEGALRYCGAVGTGFDEAALGRVLRALREREADASPFAGRQPPKGTRFVVPDLVAEVRFAEWTPDGSIRHSSFLGLRDDVPAAAVVREPTPAEVAAGGAAVVAEPPSDEGEDPVQDAATDDDHPDAASALDALPPSPLELPAQGDAQVEVEGRTLKLTNLHKVLYPEAGLTKGAVIDYYARIAPFVLPHLRDRPTTMKRYPDGVEGKAFFNKHAPSHRPDWVRTTPVPTSRKPEPNDFVVVDDLPTLVWTANLAAIELHPSLSRADPAGVLEGAEDATGVTGPTALVFDLDPGAPATIVECCEVALLLRELLDELGLRSFAKTSGSKGLQLYAPLDPSGRATTYERTKPLAHAIARLLEERHPDLVVSRMTKKLRPGKVLIDWSQNDEHKTTVGAYALRARPRPTASTPVTWEEVAGCAQDGDPDALVFTFTDLLLRVAAHGDLLAPLTTLEQDVPELGGTG